MNNQIVKIDVFYMSKTKSYNVVLKLLDGTTYYTSIIPRGRDFHQIFRCLWDKYDCDCPIHFEGTVFHKGA